MRTSDRMPAGRCSRPGPGPRRRCAWPPRCHPSAGTAGRQRRTQHSGRPRGPAGRPAGRQLAPGGSRSPGWLHQGFIAARLRRPGHCPGLPVMMEEVPAPRQQSASAPRPLPVAGSNRWMELAATYTPSRCASATEDQPGSGPPIHRPGGLWCCRRTVRRREQGFRAGGLGRAQVHEGGARLSPETRASPPSPSAARRRLRPASPAACTASGRMPTITS